MAGELLDFGHDIFGLALNLEEDNVGVVLLGETRDVKEGQEVRRTGKIIQVPVGPAMVGRVVDALGRPIDGKGPIATHRVLSLGAHRAGGHRPPAGQGARADGLEGDRRHDPDRPRPARAHHRRPPDGKNRRRPRHDHQPEGEGAHLHLRRDRPEEVHRGPGRQDPRGVRRDGAHDRRLRDRLRARADAVRRALCGLRDGGVLPLQRAARPDDLRRPLQARRVLPRDLAASAAPSGPRGLPGRRLLSPLAPAWSARPSSPTSREAGP